MVLVSLSFSRCVNFVGRGQVLVLKGLVLITTLRFHHLCCLLYLIPSDPYLLEIVVDDFPPVLTWAPRPSGNHSMRERWPSHLSRLHNNNSVVVHEDQFTQVLVLGPQSLWKFAFCKLSVMYDHVTFINSVITTVHEDMVKNVLLSDICQQVSHSSL